jgi:hypothetical protein
VYVRRCWFAMIGRTLPVAASTRPAASLVPSAFTCLPQVASATFSPVMPRSTPSLADVVLAGKCKEPTPSGSRDSRLMVATPVVLKDLFCRPKSTSQFPLQLSDPTFVKPVRMKSNRDVNAGMDRPTNDPITHSIGSSRRFEKHSAIVVLLPIIQAVAGRNRPRPSQLRPVRHRHM